MKNLIEKIEKNERINFSEALSLYDMDLFVLGRLADEKRKAMYGKKSFFNINRHINPTNECKDICKFCAFSANRKNPNPYTMSHEEILNITKQAVEHNAKEVHLV